MDPGHSGWSVGQRWKTWYGADKILDVNNSSAGKGSRPPRGENARSFGPHDQFL